MAKVKKGSQESDQKRKLICRVGWILSILSAVIIYVVHRKIPFMMDDLWYSTKLSSEEPIKNLKDILESQIWHYHNWGGRSITHGLLQIILLLGENAADLLNVAVTFLLAVCICVVSEIKKGYRVISIWAVVSMLFGLNANWKMSMFWQAGAANYLYITVVLLLFLWCYLRELSGEEGREIRPLKGIVFWMIPLGLAAGWSNENMGPTVFVISIAVMILRRKQSKRIPLWMFLGSASALIGSVIMIAAPGNFIRSAQVPEHEYGLLWRCFLRGYAESKGICEFLFPPLLILAWTLFAGVCLMKLRISQKEALLLLGVLLSWGSMVLSPHYPDRSSFGTMVLCICVILSMGSRIAYKNKESLFWLLGITGLVWLRGMYFLGEFLAICWGWIR